MLPEWNRSFFFQLSNLIKPRSGIFFQPFQRQLIFFDIGIKKGCSYLFDGNSHNGALSRRINGFALGRQFRIIPAIGWFFATTIATPFTRSFAGTAMSSLLSVVISFSIIWFSWIIIANPLYVKWHRILFSVSPILAYGHGVEQWYFLMSNQIPQLKAMQQVRALSYSPW